MKEYRGLSTSPSTDDGYSTDNSDVSLCDLDSVLNEPTFGILFDVDGVLARGSTPLDPAKKAFERLKDSQGNLRVPVAYVTNATNRSHDKAAQICRWFETPVSPENVIHAPTPAKLLREYHDRHVLVIGQEHRIEIAEDLGFTNLCTMEDVAAAYPLLDMVDHDNRVVIASGNYTENPNFPRVEAVLMIGEPKRWETNLQLLVDLLLTEGKPTRAPEDVHTVPQLPIIACNMDLQFMAEACMPRYGHGAFLLCLEALYRKITGKDIHYTALIGKPCEITYRFAEHTISRIAKQMGIKNKIKKLYFIGDNPNVDIVGANLYDRYIQSLNNRQNGNSPVNDTTMVLPSSRLIPDNADLHEQTVERCHSLLVGTGVYKPSLSIEEEVDQTDSNQNKQSIYHGHRDIAHEPHLAKPSKYVTDVYHGIQHIIESEGGKF
ncbi:hypothetical protein LOTGIDRAFT_201919 [Lottia gigantea]|uniref:Haloacid dehalogenase-like hydrolase domain-containing 5 n=1 Tax=Lottia gigantea TaxID=225164 RepID=V4AJ45_LOTGI|nr:hypothetical protein LOTGIDRAFT_201919 [Lottia gigantea]ESO97092.1 hypothetical protein LOTGIDRAFT_201919 [Lottia gigantea]